MKKEHISHTYRTWVEIDKKALVHNVKQFKALLPRGKRLMAVIKSNAYGHSLIDVASIYDRTKEVDCFAVDSIEEALTIRAHGIKKSILVLGFTLESKFSLASLHNISLTISSMEMLEKAVRFSKKSPLSIHLKIDTGLSRQGFMYKDSSKVFNAIINFPLQDLTLEGIYTHFASSKSLETDDFTHLQIERFAEWTKLFKTYFPDIAAHASATGGALLYPEATFDMVRIGIGCYGLWPSSDVEKLCKKKINLVPVLSWKSIVSEVKTLEKGSTIGYDQTYKVSKEIRTAIIPIGYWHGYPRILSSRGRVMINGSLAPVTGRVSMDMIVVDVTKIKNVKPGAIVTVVGKEKEVSASAVALRAETTNYEMVTRINAEIPRFFI